MIGVVSPGINFYRTLYIRLPSESMIDTIAVVSEESSLRESVRCRGPLVREFIDVFLTLNAAVSTICRNCYIK